MTKKEKMLTDALVNICKRAGVCWDGPRLCHDSQSVARGALKKTMKEADFKHLDNLPYMEVKVFKNGTVRYKGQR